MKFGFVVLLFCLPVFTEEGPSDFLIFSAERGYLQDVKKAISQGANVNNRDYFKKTALMYASENGNIEIIQLLMKYGASSQIDARDRYGKSALDYAREKGFPKVEKLLIEYGAGKK